MKFDTEKYKILFISESREHIENISKILENSKDVLTEEDINALFREAHSIKGISSAMGYNDIAEVSHLMENLMGQIRSGSLLMDNDIREKLIDAVDNLWKAIDCIEKNQKYEGLSNVIFNLKEFKNIKKEESSIPDNIYEINIIFHDDIPSLSARAFLIYKNVQSFGEIVQSEPSIEVIKKGELKNKLTLKIKTNKLVESIKKYLSQVSEIKDYSISEEKVDDKKSIILESKHIDKPVLSKLVKVDVDDLDYFLNITGELLTIKTQIREGLQEIENIEITNSLNQMEILLKDLQNKVMKMRLVPLDIIFANIPRWVRDLSQKLNKKVNLEIKGGEIELDRAVIDALADPILHIIRNSIDHGIESEEERVRAKKNHSGSLKIFAYKEKDRVIITVEDDGKGIDVEKVKKAALNSGKFSQTYINSLVDKKKIFNLLTIPGLSTKDNVTDISGRGVGLDVVKTVIESFGGVIDIDSEISLGTKISLTIPSTISIVNILIFRADNYLLGTPVDKIKAVKIVKFDEIYVTLMEKGLILLDDDYIPAMYLNEKLGLDKGVTEKKRDLFCIVLEVFGKRSAVLVDNIVGYKEVYLRPLNKPLSLIPGFYSSAILGDGTPILIVDLQGLIS